MEKDEIKITDWIRIIVGDVPAVFFLEIILRALVVYAILMIAYRLMGSRMAGQLNRIEQAALVTLAAAIGVPMQSPERGLVPPVIIALVVVASSRLIAWRSARNEKFESASQGSINTLVQDGMLCIKDIKRTTLTRERVFAQLRCNKIIHLGEVRRLFFESNGSFTLVKEDDPDPGLAILPEHDLLFLDSLPKTGREVCSYCGNTRAKDPRCDNCGNKIWVSAVAVSDNNAG